MFWVVTWNQKNLEALKGKGKIPKAKIAKSAAAKEEDLEKGFKILKRCFVEALKESKIPKAKIAKNAAAKEDDLEEGTGDLVGKKMRIIDDGHAFCGRCFVCEASSAEYAKGHVGKDPGGYWKDDKRVGNVFVKISSVQIVEEDEQVAQG